MKEKEKDKDAVESHAPKKSVRSLFRKKRIIFGAREIYCNIRCGDRGNQGND